MEYIQLHAEDENGENMDLDENFDEENDQDRGVIDVDDVDVMDNDTNQPNFYRKVDNVIDLIKNVDVEYIKNNKITSEDIRERPANSNNQVENYTMQNAKCKIQNTIFLIMKRSG